ncbi:LCP family protein [Nocardioides jishulii]|uniref:LytR family transcriptional regulator n=1 Tax=Nocardioides jishulii TaxID=2575440 RepID=A0A4U2YUF4_9ACTN|nr:LCP family protein [Nocardioides jishulii]QCX28552.1 LytR family transcriptional regulator [Nocardioides jishulii]TKI64555.1 LytR family transcriptional regulator [Nocardioides jishulii]
MSEVSEPSNDAGTGPKRRGRKKKRHTVGTVILSTILVLSLVTGLGAVAFYRSISGNINRSTALDEVNNRPEDFDTGPKKPVRILVMGTDTRLGKGNKLDGENVGVEHSDTNILLHISADRKRAYGISIPRDSLVTRPDCGANDEIAGAENSIWNKAFEIGREGCTVEQFELNTGVRVDGFVKLDFNGFKGMVDALDGVPVCVPYDIDDPKHDIFIKAGEREIRGAEALDYVRVRAVGSGSDIGRISRQQTFIASMVKKVSSAGTLSRPDKVLAFLKAVASALTISENMSDLKQLAGIAMSLQNVGMDKVQFVTVPFTEFPRDSPDWGRVAWTEQADEMWRRIARDKPLGAELTSKAIRADRAPGKEKGDSSDSPSPSASESPEPGEEKPTEAEVRAAEYEARCA